MRRGERERAFERQWGDLATYNAEVARGIVHTPEWDARMAEKQARYNDGLRAWAMKHQGWDPAETHPEDFPQSP